MPGSDHEVSPPSIVGGGDLAWLEALDLAAVILDARGRVLAANAAARTLVPQSGSSPSRRPTVADLLPRALRRVVHRTLAAHPGARWVGELALHRRDGTSAVVHVSCAPVLGVGWVCTATDITEEKRREQQQRRTEEMLRVLSSAVEQTADLIFVTDPHGIIEYVNPAFEQLTGWSAAAIIGHNAGMLRSGAHGRPFYNRLWRTILDGTPFRAEFINRKRSGELYREEKTITPIRDAEGRITHFVSTGKDVTERRRTEQQRQQAQKMEAVGRLAGGIAHDFNNVLATILSTADLLAMRALGKGAQGDIEAIRSAARHGSSLTRQLLAFSRRQVLQPAALDLNQVVRDMECMLGPMIGAHIRLDLELHSSPVHVLADHGQLEQVLMNLIVNARDAMPAGGVTRLATSDAVFDDDATRPVAGMPAGRYACLTVADTGIGMDAPTMARIFEPFFTTKPPGEGSGLGLATVYGIVQQSGGYIGVQSTPDVGSTFQVWLPHHPPPSQPASVQHLAGCPVVRGSETVLVVDDDDAVRAAVAQLLELHGYSVLRAASGDEALAVFTSDAARVDLVLTDLILPGMSGHDLAAAVRAHRPEQPIVLMSGFNEALLDGKASACGAPLLRKPFALPDLLGTIRRLLNAA